VARQASRAIGRSAVPLILTGAFVLLVVVGAAAWSWMRTTSRFAARDVVVTGTTRLSPSDVMRRARVQPGTNLFALSLARVERALAASPWIEEVRVRRDLPDRLIVEVREKQPAALVLAEAPYVADREGRPFKRARLESGEADGLPVVTGIDRALFASRPEAAQALVKHALALHEAWRRVPGRPAIGEVHLDGRGATLYTWHGGVGVRLGRSMGTELEARLSRFDEVWAALSVEERATCQTVFLDGTTRPDRVTIRRMR
jgi:cell division protein FtsQ